MFQIDFALGMRWNSFELRSFKALTNFPLFFTSTGIK